MRVSPLACCLIGALLIVPVPFAHAAEASDALRGQLLKTTQALVDALPTGNKAPWENALTEDAVVIDEFGRVASKAESVSSLHPFPSGFSGSIELRHAHAWQYGDTALLQVEECERETVFGQNFVVRYLSLLTFVKQSGEWKVAGYEDVTIPTPPPKLDVPNLVLSDYAGTFRYGPGRAWTITSDHGVLHYVTRPGNPSTVLEPIAKDVFMSGDDEHNLLIFRRDDHGKVIALIERRKFNDLRLDKES